MEQNTSDPDATESFGGAPPARTNTGQSGGPSGSMPSGQPFSAVPISSILETKLASNVAPDVPRNQSHSAVDPPEHSAVLGRIGPVSTPSVESVPQPPDSISDGELVQQVLNGRHRSFDELIKRYQRQAVAVSYRLLGNTHDALEVTQDAFLKAFGSISTLQKPEAFGGWLLRIVSNLSLNFRRGRRNKSQLPLDDLLGSSGGNEGSGGSEWMARSGDPVRNLESQEMGAKLQEALKQLPEKQRLAIVMFTIEELPQKQVAEALDISVEAVKWHVFQGRKRLKELLKSHL